MRIPAAISSAGAAVLGWLLLAPAALAADGEKTPLNLTTPKVNAHQAEHIGVVESFGTDGTITTIEGNSSDSVARRTYGSDGGGAIGFVRLG
jgi:hypothetical protein